MSLMVSISGIRGIVGESLTPEIIVKYASAFAEYCNHGTIVIGRDGRSTGKMIGNIISSTLIAAGCDVVALGVVPTPTVALAVGRMKAAGGISITASHNPMVWNGMKFIGPSGVFLNGAENARLWEIAAKPTRSYAVWDKIGTHRTDELFIEQHIRSVLALPLIRPDMIQKRRFKVVVDCINAAGGNIVPALLREFGCRVVEMNCDISGVFSRMPEPVPENLTALYERVLDEKADFGIAVDPDVDRLVLITEKGEPFGEENTIATAVKFVLEQRKARTRTAIADSVVVNLSTTRAIEDIAAKNGAGVFRSPVGEINVVTKMKEVNAVIGGEGSGGVILPELHHARDAMVGIALVLQQMAEFNGTLSDYRAALPQYVITKSKIGVGSSNPDAVLESLAAKFAGAGAINRDDGLKIDFERSWVHLRKSNTEPIIRIIAEAPTALEANDLVKKMTLAITA
jgi:phosphomannomutase